MAEQKTSASPARQPTIEDIIHAMLPFLDEAGDIPAPPPGTAEAWGDRLQTALFAIGLPTKLARLAEYYAALGAANWNRSGRQATAAGLALQVIDREMVSHRRRAEDEEDIDARIWWLQQDENWELCSAREDLPRILRHDVTLVLERGNDGEAMPEPDAELIRIAAELEQARAWQKVKWAQSEAEGAAVEERVANETFLQVKPIADKVLRHRATTMAGLRAKAKAVAWLYDYPTGRLAPSDDYAESILRDLLAEGEEPDARSEAQ